MTFLIAAFVGVWVVVTAYVVYMGQRQRQLEQEMLTIEELLGERSKK
jgi:CcmD family protein